MLDIHHVPNIVDGKKYIKDFDVRKAVAIAIPTSEHKKIKVSKKIIINARQLLALEIYCLKKFTDIPISVLLELIKANKNKYHNQFKKIL